MNSLAGNTKRKIEGQAIASFLAVFLTSCSPAGHTELSSSAATPPPTRVFIIDPDLSALLKKTEPLTAAEKTAALESFLKTHKGDAAASPAAYVLGKALLTGDLEAVKKARSCFEMSGDIESLKVPSLRRLAECGKRLADDKLVRQSLAGITQWATTPEEKAEAQYQLAQTYLDEKLPDEARKHFNEVKLTAPDSPYALGSNFFLGGMELEAQKTPEALLLWREYLKACPEGRFAPEIVLNMNRLRLDSSDHVLFGDVYAARECWSDAFSEYTLAMDPSTWFKRGTCSFKLGKRSEARELIADGIKSYSDSPEVPDAATLVAKHSDRQGAIAVWKLVLEKSTKHKDAALYNLALRAPESEALGYYNAVADKYPDSDFAPESRWRVIFARIKAGKNAEALTQLQKYAPRYASARAGSRFAFWTGKVLERLKRVEEAKKAYANAASGFGENYYGWRSRARLAALSGKRDRGFAVNSKAHLAAYTRLSLSETNWDWPEPPHLIPYEKLATECGASTATLLQLRQWDECLSGLKKDQCPPLRSYCMARLDMPLDAINVMARNLKGTPDQNPVWQLSYPLLYSKTVFSESKLKGVDPLLAQALTREESRYNIHALSSSNAHGLMQLLPGTAYGVAKRLGVKLQGVGDIHKPEVNLKLGIDYMSYTLARNNGNAMLAVASYNGGPNAVARWVKLHGQCDPDIFVESIPYKETRDYVRKVFGSYWNYEAIYTPTRGV